MAKQMSRKQYQAMRAHETRFVMTDMLIKRFLEDDDFRIAVIAAARVQDVDNKLGQAWSNYCIFNGVE